MTGDVELQPMIHAYNKDGYLELYLCGPHGRAAVEFGMKCGHAVPNDCDACQMKGLDYAHRMAASRAKRKRT